MRRCLYTLALLDYVARDERGYSVRRQALALGHAFLSLNALATRAQPLMDASRDQLGESCSLGVMEHDQLYYVPRAEAACVMSVGLKVGSCLPLYCTSMGRMPLAGRTPAEQEAYLARTRLETLTPHTVTDSRRLLVVIRSAATNGYAVVDQELELGLRSVAVPVISRGKAVATLNVGTAAARLSLTEMSERILPALFETAAKLSN